MLQVTSQLATSVALSPCERKNNSKTHIHVSTEGYKYIAGGNGVFVNTFCKAFHQRTCKNIVILPLLHFENEPSENKSISCGYQFSNGEVVLVERCSDAKDYDVYRIQPTGDRRKYFECHINPYDIKANHKESLKKEVFFKDKQGFNKNNGDLKSAAAISLKFCIFNQMAARFIDEALLPALANEDVYVHDHFYGGALQYITGGNNVRKINWIHCLSPHAGFSDGLAEGSQVYATESYLEMDLDTIKKLPDYDKPVRERAIKHADVVLTVSKYAESFLKNKHPLVSKFLKIHEKEAISIKSCSDLSKFNLFDVGKNYEIDSFSRDVIKSKLKELYFSGELPVSPPVNASGNVDSTFIKMPVVFFMGRPSYEKGTQHVLSMVKKLNCLFFIVSNGCDQDEFIKELNRVNKERNNIVLLTSNQEHKQLLMAIADYAVIPSLAESLGLIAGECNSMGLHIITSNVGGLTESSPDCIHCRTIVNSNAEYGCYSQKTDDDFLSTVKQKIEGEQQKPSHIARHASFFHSIERFTSSIETAIYDSP